MAQLPKIVTDAQATANRKILGNPRVDEGTASIASEIQAGTPVPKVKARYTRIGNRNFPKTRAGNDAAKTYRRSLSVESDAGDVSGYDPNLGVKYKK